MKRLGYLSILITTIGAISILHGCGTAKPEPKSNPPVVQPMDIQSSDKSPIEAGSGSASAIDAPH